MAEIRRGKRCDHDVTAAILATSIGGTNRTGIMYGANLSGTLLNKYLTSLVNNGLLHKVEREGKILYTPTEKGLTFLAKYRDIQRIYPTKTKQH